MDFDGSFEDIAEVGDRIRAWDHQPIVGRPEYFCEGKVIAKGIVPILRDEEGLPYGGGFAGFTILVDHDNIDWDDEDHPNGRVSTEVYVPFDSCFDWVGRVQKLIKEESE